MSDVERALELLIHDVRTPVGVAQGYVRLLREHRLEADEDRERALDRTMEALGRIAQLCTDAGGFVDRAAAAGGSVVIAASALAASVDARARRLPMTIGRVRIDPQARIRGAGDPERLAEAICVVLATLARPPGEGMPTLEMETRQADLRFTVESAVVVSIPLEERPA
jgi:signal transduction histidine kinase